MAQLTLRENALGKRLAAHLLRRTTYNVNPDRVNEFALKTADEAVEELLQPANLLYPDGPLFYGNGNPVFELGRVTDDSGEVAGVLEGGGNNRLRPYYGLWRIYESIHCPTAQWRIIHWFASLFTLTADGGGARYHYHFWRLLRHLSFDNLKTLAFKVTTDNNMLHYLDNHQNRVNNINENYAREFLELFTILKGPVVSVGNYTNYTEADITTAAKVLTGWRLERAYTDPETGIVAGQAYYNRHDSSDKTFSAAFQSRTITGAVDEADMYRELQEFVDMIFDQLETARAFTRKMYRFFVSDNIDEEIEVDIIEPLAAELNNNGYQHIPVLKTLLKSVHFYDEDDSDSSNEIIGGKIKSPMELFCTSVNLLNIENTDQNDLERHFKGNYNRVATEHFTKVGMDIIGPPTVEGFPGYYDETAGFSKAWFKTNVLYERFTYGLSFRRGKVRNNNGDIPYKMDISTLPNGVYTLAVYRSNGKRHIERIVKE